MGRADILESLVAGAYEAAVDNELWPGWTDRLVQTLGGTCASFVVLYAGAVERLVHVRTSYRIVEEYAAYRMSELDPQIPYAASRRCSGYYLDTDHVDLNDPKTAEFTAWIGSVGMRHHITMASRLDGGRIRAGISIHRAVADGATPAAAQRELAALVPDFTRAMELGFVHNRKLLESYWEGLAAGRDLALLVDDEGRVVAATEALLALVAGGGGLKICRGRLQATEAADDEGLQRLLVMGRATRARSGALRISRASGGPPLVVTVYPLPKTAPLLATGNTFALITVVDPADAAPGTANVWRDAFGFTPKEAELAELLMAGHSLESASSFQTTTLHTTRVHIRRLLSKTGTTRQAELVRLLGRIGR